METIKDTEKKDNSSSWTSTGFTIWLTGLSGAGKTTVCHELQKILLQHGVNSEALDGDIVRTHLSKGLGFSKEDRDTNILRIAWVSSVLTKHGVANIAAAISPYRETRAAARDMIDRFVEVFVDCPLEICEQRDTKGLYKKARAGELTNFTGIDDPYEPPANPEVVINTSEETAAESAQKIVNKLLELKYLS